MIAALFVQKNGCYFGLPDVDPWDEARDARLYAGPWPVVAHPPCSRWCRLAGLVEARWGYKKGDDGGCFESALNNVRRVGGVLEHPAYSDAFAHYGLPEPRPGGWQRGICGGWVCHVEQWHYGHAAKKATWLYAFGVSELPSLIWGVTPDTAPTAYVTDGGGDVKRRKKPALVERWGSKERLELAETRRRAKELARSRPVALVSWCGNHTKAGEDRPRLRKKAASATPLAFRDLLLSVARSAHRSNEARPA